MDGFFSRVSPAFLGWVRVTAAEASVIDKLALCALIQEKG
jgi:hypothetical protein